MKYFRKGSLVIILTLIGFLAISQDNIHLFAEEGTKWSVGNFYPHPSVPHNMIFSKMLGDTLIEGNTYYKIWHSDEPFSESVSGLVACYAKVGIDSVLIIRAIDNTELIVFDFKLDFNDNVLLSGYRYFDQQHYNSEQLSASVTYKTDTIIFDNQRQIWILNGYGESMGEETWIEGVGPSAGILCANIGLNDITGFDPILLCAELNGEQIYNNPRFDFCELFSPEYYDKINLLAEENTVWSIAKFNAPYQLMRKDFLWLKGNTQNHQYDYDYYHKIFISDVYPPTLENSELAFYVKIFEDSILYIKSLNNVEHPVFDFKLNPGDNAELYGFDYVSGEFYPLNVTIEDTGQIETLSGDRKYWDVISTGYTRWIQGLGNEEGIIYANSALQGLVGETNFMICAFNGDDQLYINSLFSDCLTTDICDEQIECPVNVRFFDGKILISSEEPIYAAEIIDISGKVIYKEVYSGKSEILISDTFLKGIYFVRIKTDQKFHVFKLLLSLY